MAGMLSMTVRRSCWLRVMGSPSRINASRSAGFVLRFMVFILFAPELSLADAKISDYIRIVDNHFAIVCARITDCDRKGDIDNSFGAKRL